MNGSELLQEMRAAYQVLGLKPVRRTFFFKHKHAAFACPITTLALFRGAVRRTDPYLGLDSGFNPAYGWACIELGGDFVCGLLDAWDGHEQVGSDVEYLEGYRLGAALAQEILPGGEAMR